MRTSPNGRMTSSCATSIYEKPPMRAATGRAPHVYEAALGFESLLKPGSCSEEVPGS